MTTAHTRRQFAAIVVVRAASSAGYFALLPFLGVWLVQAHGQSGGASGAVVAVAILSNRAGGFLLAPVIGRTGFRGAITYGYLLAAILLTGMSQLSGGVVVWGAVMTCLGLCLAAATTAQRALIAEAFAAEDARLKGFSYLNVAVNAGSALGPVAGGAAFHWHPASLGLLAGALMALAALASFALPSPAKAEHTARDNRFLAFDRELFTFLALTAGTWIGYSMAFNVLAAYLAPKLSSAQIGLLFTLNAVIVIVCQVPVGKRVGRLLAAGNRRYRFGLVCLGSNAVMAVSLILFGAGRSWGLPAAVVAMVVFTSAEMIWATFYDAEVTVRRGRLSNAMAYGTAGLVWGAMESLGAWMGLYLVVAAAGGPTGPVGLAAVPFWGAALAGLAAGTLLALNRRGARRDASPSPPPVEVKARV